MNTWACPLSFEDWLEILESAIEEEDHVRLVHGQHNLHSLFLCLKSSEMETFFSAADVVYIDGTPVRWLFNLAGLQVGKDCRFTLMDLIEKFLGYAEKQSWRIFYVGGRSDALRTTMHRIRDEFPSLKFGCHHGYFDMTGGENERVLGIVNRFSPDVLLVGMGMPRQEKWITANRSRLMARNIVATGATIDYYAETQRRPPGWLGPLGLAGLYRMSRDPKRLWRRYLVEPWAIAAVAGKWILQERRERRVY